MRYVTYRPNNMLHDSFFVFAVLLLLAFLSVGVH